jgi:hypothetical protein
MAKKKAAGKGKRDRFKPERTKTRASKTNGALTHRVTTHDGNASTSMEVAPEKVNIGEAMRLAVEALGERVIDNDLAPQQLAELGGVLEDITRRRAAFDAKNEEAKTAKKSLESALDLLVEKVRSFTHPIALPLFDNQEREKDLAEMRGGGEVEELGAGPAPVADPEWGTSGFNGAGH